jgi:hypothetical protein
MKLEDLKDAVPFETILKHKHDAEVLYAGINPISLRVVTSDLTGESHGSIGFLEDWSIKQPKPKLKGPYYMWECFGYHEEIVVIYYADSSFRLINGNQSSSLLQSKWKRKVGEPIWINEDGIPTDSEGNILT